MLNVIRNILKEIFTINRPIACLTYFSYGTEKYNIQIY